MIIGLATKNCISFARYHAHAIHCNEKYKNILIWCTIYNWLNLYPGCKWLNLYPGCRWLHWYHRWLYWIFSMQMIRLVHRMQMINLISRMQRIKLVPGWKWVIWCACHTKVYKIGIGCFADKQALSRSKNNDLLGRNKNNVKEWSDISRPGLFLKWAI